MTAERERSKLLQRDLAASLRDSKEALHREVEIMAQLEQQDEVCPLHAACWLVSCLFVTRETFVQVLNILPAIGLARSCKVV